MKNDDQVNGSAEIAVHLVAAIVGFLTMMMGVGLSVTMVLLPVGIPLGLVGLGLLMWSLSPTWRE
jgi:hypothetical protein